MKSSSAAIRLLDERFDRQTGRYRAGLGLGAGQPNATPMVQVRVMSRTELGGESPRLRPREPDPLPGSDSVPSRPSPAAIAETITRAAAASGRLLASGSVSVASTVTWAAR